MHRLLEGRSYDLFRRQADALVDDLEARVARAHRDLLGPVGMAVEAGLADQHLEGPAEAAAHGPDLAAQLGELDGGIVGGPAHPGRCAIFAEDVAQNGRPFAGRDSRRGRQRSTAP